MKHLSNNILRRLAVILLSLMALYCHAVGDGASPKYEMRGAWIATVFGIDWPAVTGTSSAVAEQQQKDLELLLRKLHDAGFNAVFFQVRPMADAVYHSEFEAPSSFISGRRGTPAPYDPLAQCIATAHSLGMECHGWINPFRVGQKPPSTPLDKIHSHLWMTNAVGRSTMTIFNPAHADTRKHICKIVSDIAQRYDIDGIVFDDYFYNPEFLPEDNSASDYDDYVASGTDMTMADWRRDNINRTISEVASTLASIKGGRIRFGVSPQGIAGGNGIHSDRDVPLTTAYGIKTGDSQYSKIYSDPVIWLLNGDIDYISPQIYWRTDNPRHPYGGLSRWWNDVAKLCGRHCFASLTVSSLAKDDSPEAIGETVAQISANRDADKVGAPGSVLYSASCVVGPKNATLATRLSEELFASRALVPPMTWKDAQPVSPVSNLHLDGDMLKWDAEPGMRYVVYAIPDNVDLIDALDPVVDGFAGKFILGISYSGAFKLSDDAKRRCKIAVTPYDRYGNEWEASFLTDNQ